MRVNPGSTQKERLWEANAYRCCVCKRQDVGLHLHHIDLDSSNTIDENLAVLCVEDHDRHHRPSAYPVQLNHLELNAEQIRQHKRSWEAFVIEARQVSPNIVATVAAYGTVELVHSFQLVMQWPDQRIEFTRSYHLLDASIERSVDAMIREIKQIGRNIKVLMISDPLPVEHCPCCGVGLSRTLKPAVVLRHTDPNWRGDSACSIYINPETPRITLLLALRQDQLLLGSLHLCQGRFLHYHSEDIDERVSVRRRPSVRAQATRIVRKFLNEWSPAKVFIGTGDPEAPKQVDGLNLPAFWEMRS